MFVVVFCCTVESLISSCMRCSRVVWVVVTFCCWYTGELFSAEQQLGRAEPVRSWDVPPMTVIFVGLPVFVHLARRFLMFLTPASASPFPCGL